MGLIIPKKKQQRTQGIFVTEDGVMIQGERPREPHTQFETVEQACESHPALKAAAHRRKNCDDYCGAFGDYDPTAVYELKLEDARAVIDTFDAGGDVSTLSLTILDQEAAIRGTDLLELARQVLAYYPAMSQRQAVVAAELSRVALRTSQSDTV